VKGEKRMANGEWRMANGEWRMANGVKLWICNLCIMSAVADYLFVENNKRFKNAPQGLPS